MDPLEKQTDQMLVEASLKDPNAYNAIITRYSDALDRYVRRLGCGVSQDREDLLQEIFLKAYLNLNSFDTTLKFSSWLYRIAHNETISFYRKTAARPKTTPVEADEQLAATLTADDDIIKEVSAAHAKQQILNALYNIDEKYREVLILYYFEEKGYDEIADILQKPPGTIATLISRAKAKLKPHLTHHATIT